MKKFLLTGLVMSTFALGACQATTAGDKEIVGSLGGAVAGGLLGGQIGDGNGQIVAAAAGAVLGAYFGGEVGRSLDRADRVFASQAANQAHSAPLGETVAWTNPDSGNAGSITPVRDGQSSAGRYCREYQQSITVGGRQQEGVGTACQNPDGSWEIVS